MNIKAVEPDTVSDRILVDYGIWSVRTESDNDVPLLEEDNSDMDYMVRAAAADDRIRAFAVRGKELVETARRAHHTSPVATAALGRLLCAAVMMGRDMLKNDGDLITAQIDGDGPLKGLLATADGNGHVKGFVKNPWVILPNREDGHLDVGRGVGKGVLTVTRDMGRSDPYSGQVELKSGEIAEDINYYFAVSEQIPSSVGLGVLVDREGKVLEAGGYIIQLMPDAGEDTVDGLERNITQMPAVTELFRAGNTPETILEQALDGMGASFTERTDVSFYCNCDRDRVERALKLLGAKELDTMIADGKGEELKCRFCNKAYKFSVDDLKELRQGVK